MYLALFIASGIALIFLVVHKYMETEYDKRLIVKTIAHRADSWFHVFFGRLAHILSFVSLKNIVVFINKIAVFLVRWVLALIASVRKNTTGAVEKLSHTKETIQNKGPQSEYLKRISETKGTVDTSGAIEKMESGQ